MCDSLDAACTAIPAAGKVGDHPKVKAALTRLDDLKAKVGK